MQRQKLFTPYLRVVIVAGAAAFIYAALNLPYGAADARLFVLAALTIGVTSHVSIDIPGVRAKISVSDTFVFLILLLYGGEAAVLVAAGEAFISSFHSTRRAETRLFNAALMAVSMLLTAASVRLVLGQDANVSQGFTAQLVIAVCLMAIVQYVVNSALVSVGGALKAGQPLWATWRKYYLWTSITYVAGASAAAIIATLVRDVGDYAIVAATPIVVIVYFTYRTYLQNVRASVAQAEQAERHVEELNHYIREQERIREQFSQLEKLSALGELASGVAHDFNNTLAGILGRAQLLTRTSDPEKFRRGLEIIIKTAEDGAKTVRRIQDFARQRRDHDFEPIDVDQLLSDVSEITRPRWKDRAEAAGLGIRLELRVASRAPVLGDGSELREVLVNMVFNAVDAMPSGGTLTLASDESDGQIVISVSDTGTGMSPEVRSRIFDPFFTTKGKAGLGLGLAVSYGIIRRHGGSIEVDSEQGAGSTFRLTLPVAELPADSRRAEVEAEAAPVSHPPAGAARILVVDDEETVRELLRDILTGEGYAVEVASGGREALRLFEAAAFDAVFTDIGMPGMSGWELARAVRERDSGVPLAVITGWGEAVGSAEQKAAQIDWVVTKPFSAERILQLAREAAEQTHEPAGHDSRLRIVA
jgi:signal transduction histidine kinase/ActR/RegA family two-component response regulator